jgi:hypothetical protein
MRRAEAASYVLHFLRLWRSWLLRASTYSLHNNFISRETYQDITISVHNVFLLIRCLNIHMYLKHMNNMDLLHGST